MLNTFSDLVGTMAPLYHISNNLINCNKCSTHLNGQPNPLSKSNVILWLYFGNLLKLLSAKLDFT